MSYFPQEDYSETELFMKDCSADLKERLNEFGHSVIGLSLNIPLKGLFYILSQLDAIDLIVKYAKEQSVEDFTEQSVSEVLNELGY